MELTPGTQALRLQYSAASEAGKPEAASDRDARELAGAARQFEALIVERMLEAMRATLPDDSPLQGEHEDMYREMLDHELAGKMVERQGYGLAEALVRQLSPADPGAARPAPRDAGQLALDAYRRTQGDGLPGNVRVAGGDLGPGAFSR